MPDERRNHTDESQAEFDIRDVRFGASIAGHCQSLWDDLSGTSPGTSVSQLTLKKKLFYLIRIYILYNNIEDEMGQKVYLWDLEILLRKLKIQFQLFY